MNARITFLLFTLVLAASARAEPLTAYRALFVAGKSAPDGKLVEISGERGGPQAQDWKFYFIDPTARGSIREVVISNGEVNSVRTPLRGFSELSDLTPVVMPDLNFDSDKAFQIAERQAVAARTSFHWIDYRLRAGSQGVPAWTLTLLDRMGVPTATMKISAKDGTIIQPLKVDTLSPAETAPPRKPVGGLVGDVRDLGIGVGRTVSRSVLNAVGSAQEFLTGERTIGTEEEDPE